MSDTIENKTEFELLDEMCKELEPITEEYNHTFCVKEDAPEIFEASDVLEKKINQIEKKQKKFDKGAAENYTFFAYLACLAIGILLAVLIFRKLSATHFFQIMVLLNIIICGFEIFIATVIGGYIVNNCIERICESKYETLMDEWHKLVDKLWAYTQKEYEITDKKRKIVEYKIKAIIEKYGIISWEDAWTDEYRTDKYECHYDKTEVCHALLRVMLDGHAKAYTIKDALRVLKEQTEYEREIRLEEKEEKSNKSSINNSSSTSYNHVEKQCSNCIWIAGRPFAYYCTHTKNFKKGIFNKDDQYMSVSSTSSCDLFQPQENHNFKK